MNLGKKLAIIAQLALLNSVWLLNIAVYQKYNYFSEARHLAYIPNNAILCGSVRTADLTGKILYQYLYNSEVFEGYFPPNKVSKMAKSSPFKMGLDPNDQISFYVLKNNETEAVSAGILIDILNYDDFISYLTTNKWKNIKAVGVQEIYTDGHGFYATTDGEVAVISRFDKIVSKDNVAETLNSIFKNASPNNEMRKNLVKFLKANHDFVICGTSRDLIIHSPLLNKFYITGEFRDDKIAINSEFDFRQNMESIFPEHKINPTFNFDNQEAFFLLEGNFNVSDANLVPENLGVISFNDSLSLLLKKTLHSRTCSKVQIMTHGFKKLNMVGNDQFSEEINFALSHGMGMLPEFIFGIHCVQASKMDSLLRSISQKDTVLHVSEDGFYRFTFNNYDVFMKAHDGVFHIQSNRDLHQLRFPETGFSNFMYMDYNKLREAIPDFMARTMAADYDLLKHVLFYSTGCKNNLVLAKGEVVIEKGKNALLEVFKTEDKIMHWQELKDMLLKKRSD